MFPSALDRTFVIAAGPGYKQSVFSWRVLCINAFRFVMRYKIRQGRQMRFAAAGGCDQFCAQQQLRGEFWGADRGGGVTAFVC